MRKLTPLALSLALFGAACSGSSPTSISARPDDDTGNNDNTGDQVVELDDLELTAALVPFDACSAFLDHVHREAGQRVGPYGLDGFGGYYGGPIAFAEEEFALDDAAAEEAPAEEPANAPAGAEFDTAGDSVTTNARGGDGRVAGVDFSETNLQEAGVDEPDIVKTDGNRIITVANNVITVVDVSSGDPTITGTIRLEGGWARELFLAGDKLIVISDGDGGWGRVTPDVGAPPLPLDDSAVSSDGDAEAGFAEGDVAETEIIGSDFVDYGYWRETTRVTTIDLADQPTVTELIEMEGRYLSARAIDGTARVVLTARPDDLPFLYPQNQSGEKQATEANRGVVNDSTVEQWVPDYQRRNAGGTVLDEGQLVPCERIHRPEAFAGFEMLTVVGFDLSDDSLTPVDTTGVLASGETVYSSTEAMYVATNRWFDAFPVEPGNDIAIEESYSTSLHKFSLGDNGTAEYQASGSVKGHLLNQFSLDEFDGHLRVATTKGSPWGSGEDSESFITVFEQDGGNLTEVGSVGGLGRGEQIFSVRFLDDVAYVVTFRQVDPFYVVDLSSPTDPTVVGELKIPGFSSYLHPIGENLVLGVGQDADEDGRTRGAKVSLFDVSDRSNPVELSVWTGGSNSYTDAEWDHRAFTYWGPQNLAILPLSSWTDQFWGAVVLEVSADGITERGRVDQQDPNLDRGATDCQSVEPTERAQSFEEARSEIDYILLDGGKIVACSPDASQSNPVEGFFCEGPIPVDELANWYGASDDPTFQEIVDTVPADSNIYLCWPDQGGDPVVRTLIVDDDLYTMSWQFLQANDLNSLAPGARIGIG